MLLTAAAVTVVGVLTLSVPFVSFNLASRDWARNVGQPTPHVAPVAVPEAHRAAADRFRKMFRAVPLTKAEKIADPDFDL
jgi:hypothetical protein